MRHLVLFLPLCVACAHEPLAPEAHTTAAAVSAEPLASRNVRVSCDIVRRCAIGFRALRAVGRGEAADLRLGERAPEFGFDGATLDRQDRDLLAQIAKCLVDGALAGSSVRLVGRTDARGEPEYNMTLGARRAESAADFLIRLGVAPARIRPTSRGALDANGSDESGWQRDRRVDVELE